MKAGKTRKPHKKASILLVAAAFLVIAAACSSSSSNTASDLTSGQVASTTINTTTTVLPMTCEERGLKSIESILQNFESEREREMRSESRWDNPDIDYILDDVFPIESESLQSGEVACRVQADVRIQDGSFRDTGSVYMVFCMNSNTSFMGGFSGTEMLTALDECLASLRGAPDKPDFTKLSKDIQKQIDDYLLWVSNWDIIPCEEATEILSSGSSYRSNELFYTKMEECHNGRTATWCIETDKMAKAVKSETSAIAPEYKYFRDLRDDTCQSSCDSLGILEDSSDKRIRSIIQDAEDRLFEQTEIEC